MLTINALRIRNDVRRNLSVLFTTRQTSKRILITSNMHGSHGTGRIFRWLKIRLFQFCSQGTSLTAQKFRHLAVRKLEFQNLGQTVDL